MNPGYDPPDHDALTRHIDYNCLFCHNAYPDKPAGPKTSGGESVFPAYCPKGSIVSDVTVPAVRTWNSAKAAKDRSTNCHREFGA